MIFDWLDREGFIVLSWWLITTFAGAAALPLTRRLLSGLPDSGYAFARSVGLLLIGFVFWSLGVLGFVQNTAENMVFAWILVFIVAWVAYFRLPGERLTWRDWWRENKGVIVSVELLFGLMLFAWALFRAMNPNMTGTEKPMELAFMSAVQRSPAFPPNDPWMSGYAISYYHFGYILSASMATLSGVNTAVGFNMTIALLFALTGINSFGVVYNLVRARTDGANQHGLAIGIGLLGVVLVTLIGNFQLPLIELPYQSGTVGAGYLEFWDAQDRYEPPPARIWSSDEFVNLAGLQVLNPERWDFWWWFRASRVINDRQLPMVVDGAIVAESVGANVIDEFPMFSFLLADVHPHVLALPFSVLALGLALNLLLIGRTPRPHEVAFYGLFMGGLMFLNMWDGPIYMIVLVGAEGLRRLMRHEGRWLTWEDARMIGLFFMTIVGLAFFFYLPFFISFRSQASGIVPNVQFPTLFRQYFLMFAPFILLIAPFVFWETWTHRHLMHWRLGFIIAFSLLGVLFFVLGFLVFVGSLIPAYRETVLSYAQANGGLLNVIPVMLLRRLTHSVTTIILVVTLGMVLARLFVRYPADAKSDSATGWLSLYSMDNGFALLLLACAVGLTLVPEFVYLRDNFGVRINTIFKFYYQAWVMFGVVAAYAVYKFVTDVRSAVARGAYGILTLMVLILGLLYPILGTHNRAVVESGRIAQIMDSPPYTLDGGTTLASTEDYAAITCLGQLVGTEPVVVAEAIGGAYRHQYGRVGVLAGIPIVLGWENHQRQWRGETYGQIAGSRRSDIERLYNDPRWEIALEVIRLYDIDYIFYGTTERYGTGEQPAFSPGGEVKFIENLEPVCQFGESLFYRVTPRSLELVEGF